ncbi:fatty acid--CoA ligase [Sphingopyxis lindanitolerans]|uniref:3-methylmercaptopropionyl-CoA ligase n=1 Tax=Sphingopyxis lindanitolerans TaxID=2054227 RepID=A0A2S8B573_9SPHN|nr:class I adenylate-forming enzyme family protein [Sphingopyxis lindanitolerans]PQM27493.1 fatty acid--CoA ligase [Sphingopyxis lindanitolerans]
MTENIEMDFAVIDPQPAHPAWPAMTLDEARAILCAHGAFFEMETVAVRGVPTRTWANQCPNLGALARRARDQFAERELVVFESEHITYDGFFRAAAAVARHLREAGVGKGDRIAIAMRNLPEWIPIFFGITALGAIAVPLNAWWTGGELVYGLANSGSKILICDEERWRVIAPHLGELPDLCEIWVARANGAELHSPARALESLIGQPTAYGALPDGDFPAVAVEPDDDATIFYTSGTTGSPKGALGTHRNILTISLTASYNAHRAALRRGEGTPPTDARTHLLVIPLFHATGCHATLMNTVMAGNRLVLMRKWDPLEAMRLIERERIFSTGGVPTIAWQLIEHPERHRFDLSSLAAVSYGGAPSAPELVQRIGGDLNAFASNGWGMTETSGTVTLHSAEDYAQRPDSCGPPVAVADLRIMSPEGDRELPTGEVGELWAAGPQIVKGYWRNPAATAATFVNGWVRTGDLARIDAEGFCYIVDRAKDMIIRGGENIYSTEVENILYGHPGVIDAALVGIPHRILGEVPGAIVHLADGAAATEADLQEWVRARIAAFKVPVSILFVPELLPRNANGKILKGDLKALFEPR